MAGTVQTTIAQTQDTGDDALDALEAIGQRILEPIRQGVEESVARARAGFQGAEAGTRVESTRQRVSRSTIPATVKDVAIVAAGVGGVVLIARTVGVL